MKQVVSILLLLSLFSCGSEHSNVDQQSLHEPNHSILVWTNFYFLDPEFKRLNFPFWWKEEMISQHEISQLTITKIQYLDTIAYTDEHIEFGFYSSGAVKNILRKKYDYATEIKNDLIQYEKNTTTFKPFIVKNLSAKQTQKERKNDIVFKSEKATTKDYVFYESSNPSSHPSEIYISNEEKQNVSFVDQLVDQYKEAYFYYGTIEQPRAAFFQRDLVQRSRETAFDYYSNEVLKRRSNKWSNYFEETTFIYDSLGLLARNEQRTFSNDSLLIDLKISVFEYEPHEDLFFLPAKVVHYTVKNDSTRKVTGIEEMNWSTD